MAAASGVAQSRFVVVGGGIAGVTCAEKVRAVGRLPAGRMRAPRRLAVRVFLAVSAERGPCFICSSLYKAQLQALHILGCKTASPFWILQ